jgi:hypothetical protein
VRSLRETGCGVVYRIELDSKPFDGRKNEAKVLQRISFTIEDIQKSPIGFGDISIRF